MEQTIGSTLSNRQVRFGLLAFLLLFALLAIGYFSFLKKDFSVLYSDLRAADASAIVAELESKGVEYRLRDGGSTILVPEGEADSVRLAIVGSEVPSKGTSGFELFNKSDMGLTDFAQKINYQRALQGELARTIMMMDGVADARVHLALPERSLFRSNRSTPKAAVTLSLRRGTAADEARVSGIQRLVAAAVPDLALHDVVVLDEAGRVISAAPSDETTLSAGLEEQTAVQQYYRARTRAAVENVLPGLPFDVKVLVLAKADAAEYRWQDADAPPAGQQPAQARGEGTGRRDFRLRITVLTATPLNAEDQALAASAVSAATQLEPNGGDALIFAVGPTGPAPAASRVAESSAATTASPGTPAASFTGDDGLFGTWTSWLLLIGAGVILLLVIRARSSGLPAEEREEFVRRIRRHLGLSREDENVRTR